MILRGQRIRYLVKNRSFLEFRGQRIRYLPKIHLEQGKNQRITERESATASKTAFLSHITERLSSQLSIH